MHVVVITKSTPDTAAAVTVKGDGVGGRNTEFALAAALELDRRQVELASKYPLDPGRYMVLDRATRADVEIFRPQNVPLMTEQDRLTQQYQQITGAMTVTFDGTEQTLPQMARYQQLTDRGVREASWRAVAERRLRDLELDNVTVIVGDGTLGAPEHAPFDRVVVTAAAAEVPPALIDQLREDGILVAPIGPPGGVQHLRSFRKRAKEEPLEQQELLPVRFVPLVPGKAAAL